MEFTSSRNEYITLYIYMYLCDFVRLARVNIWIGFPPKYIEGYNTVR